MPSSPQDSALFAGLFGDPDISRLFGDAMTIRAMLLVEGALAEAQGAVGLIPETAARAISKAAREAEVDPASLAADTARSAVPVPALVAAFRAALAPEHAAHVHFGATSQDIVDTALALRLRAALDIADTRLAALLRTLARHADTHAALPMAARTYGQVATPTSWGETCATWGRPLLSLRDRLPGVRTRALAVSLGGAAGTLSAMQGQGRSVRARMAEILGLTDPDAPLHSDRTGIAELAAWCAQVASITAKMGADLVLLTGSGQSEVRLADTGGSSTMPQKANPVGPSVLVALGAHALGLNTTVQGAVLHRQARDAGAWLAEWLALPGLVMAMTRSLALAEQVAAGMAPDPARMAANLDDGAGLIFAEALVFRLAESLPRPVVQAEVTTLCRQVQSTGTPLPRLAAARWPDLDLAPAFDATQNLGEAPAQARAFAAQVDARARGT
jgi:3-carboxy-cis,cis-muconate cycloisomerase